MFPLFEIYFKQTLAGDTVDCIDKRKQPAFEHPLLKHHKIQVSLVLHF